uniref:Acyl-[acyl-carrier-protein] desaturase n=1 Tax=Leersia perrieri TaxID=77586 RepID=A0A0D9X5A3_9ORYZ
MAVATTYTSAISFGFSNGNFHFRPPPTPTIRFCRRISAAAMTAVGGGVDAEEAEELRRCLSPARLEVLDQMEPWVESHVLPLLKSPEDAWQPSDMVPDPAALGAEGFHAACVELRERAAAVPDEHLVCLVGNMVTEEALPTYQSVVNRFESARDVTGSDGTAWARWVRGWSAEENRHGDVLNRYMYLSGRLDMRQVERTVHRLIRSGMAMHAPVSPYHGFIYVAFQERATSIAHGNTARHVGVDPALARICGAIAADEKRHEVAYTRVVERLLQADPDATVRALAYMMRRRIIMPASLMDDGCDVDLFTHYAAVAQQAGVYTASDYRGILEHLIQRWRVAELDYGLSGEGRGARDYVCALPQKIRRMEEKAHDRAAQMRKKPTPVPSHTPDSYMELAAKMEGNATAGVQIVSRRMIRPDFTGLPQPPERETTIHLTPWDLPLLTVEYIQKGVLLPKPPTGEGDEHFVEHLASSFARALGRFYPFAGRLAMDEHGAYISVSLRCSNAGAEFVHATAPDVAAASPHVIPRVVWSLFQLNGLVNADAAFSSLPILAAQVTELADGVFVGVSLNHVAGDGTNFWEFMNTWSAFNRNSPSPSPPPLIINRFFPNTCPVPIPLPFSNLEQAIHQQREISNTSPPTLLQECFFHFSAASVRNLKSKANAEMHRDVATKNSPMISSLQAVLAHAWRAVSRARGLAARHDETSYTMAIGCRGRVLRGVDYYLGNAVVPGVARANAGEIEARGIGWTAWRLNRLVASFDDGDGMIEAAAAWARRPEFFSLARRMRGGTAVNTGSSPRFDVFGNDFGWGSPVAVRSGGANKFDGKVTVYEGNDGAGAGSMSLEVCLVPATMEKLLADDEMAAAATMPMPLANRRFACKPITTSSPSTTRTTLFGKQVTTSSIRWSCSTSAIRSSTAMGADVIKKQQQEEEKDELHGYLSPAKLDILKQMEPWVESHILPLLKPVESAWQPSDLIPDPSTLCPDAFHEACLDIRARAAGVPDPLLACLVANMVTEEALPTYQSSLNRVKAVGDTTGDDGSAWARWVRGWSAEENRHGDVLNRYMYLSGRFNMREVERTVHRMIRSGFAVHPCNSPYHAFVYTAFQERATAVSHGNTARLVGARGRGDATLARICGTVAADEKRHEAAYTRIVSRLFDADPDAAVRAAAHMLRRGIAMPTSPISDGRRVPGDMYACVVSLAEQAGTYTASDYCDVVEHLVREWRVAELEHGISGEGRRARDYVCELPQKIRRLKEKAHDRAAQMRKKPISIPINWIFDRHDINIMSKSATPY